jgi:diguanylate cyclase (GGDEF)-like protein
MQEQSERKIIAYLKHKEGFRVPVVVRGIPIIVDNEVLGAVEVFEDLTPVIISSEKISELKEEAYFDYLTGLPNRRNLELIFDKFLADYRRDQRTFGLILVDLDNFKEINDTYGHLAGDEAIKFVSRNLRSAIRQDDFLGRWGGDEFLILLQRVTHTRIGKICQKLLSSLKYSESIQANLEYPLSVSIGAAIVDGNDQFSEAFGNADKALKIAKESGKGKYSVDELEKKNRSGSNYLAG